MALLVSAASAGGAGWDVHPGRPARAGIAWIAKAVRKTLAREAEPSAGVPALRAILDLISDGVMVADMTNAMAPLIYVNAAFERITGYSAQQVIGRNSAYLHGSDNQQPELLRITKAICAGKRVRETLRNYRKDGAMFWNDLELVPVFDAKGACTHYVGVMRDVTELLDLRTRLNDDRHVDGLTAVSTRGHFSETLADLLRAATTNCVLLVKVDLVSFNEINTSYGYEIGDQLLAQIGGRLIGLPEALVGRAGADEFSIALPLANTSDAPDALEGVLAVLRAPYTLTGASIETRFAVGWTLGAHGEDPTRLIRQAGTALQASKRSRLREPRSFDAQIDADIRNRMQLTSELQQAIARSEFELHFQPKVDLASGALRGAEALVRWRHPVFGLQPPSRFIPIAEETGLILDIGAWVLKEAAAFCVELNRDRATVLPVAANVSQLQFTARDVVGLMRCILRSTGAAPSALILELTESVFAEDSPEMLRTFHDLRDMGLGLSIDDFGTGYSSLRYLERFPITEVKIDRAFVQELPATSVRQAIVEAVIKLGARLNVDVTAEGVETASDLEVLRRLGCGLGQGYLFGAPMPANDFLHLARSES